ncbi:FK506-binding protein 15 isoform X2 [Halyomorpha halys]|uniref:FK506-binding protein 15 isoform X2 n=1 Tax=Halyomorpha halys TaxID=286706 RepID=UPI0006D4E0C2|nr:FK506-binding protein 15-like isoform X2 [Halyomorpha halys]
MCSDIEEDFPLNGGSDRLAKLFEDNTLDDISFKFSLPKHPTAKLQKPAHNSVPLKVIHAKTVEAFQMKIGGYKSEGKVGVAIIGNDEYFYYQLYMYRSDERKVSSAEISFQFNFLVQDHNYASFKDSLGIQWSIHFDKSSDLINFAKEIALARWRSTPSCEYKLIQDAFKGKTENVIKKDDNIKVNYKIYHLSPENTLQEESSEKNVTAPASSPNWEVNLIGMCLKSRRFIIMPSQQSESEVDLSLSHGVKLMMELEVEEISSKTINSQTSCSLGIQNTSSKRSSEKKEAINLSERMSRIGYALPNVQVLETGTSLDTPNKLNSLSQKPITNIPSTTSMIAGGSVCSSEIGDVTVTSQFNMLFSEVRTSNSEIRMNLSKVNDKIDVLISKIGANSQLEPQKTFEMEKIKNVDGFLGKLAEQNNTIMSLLEKNSLSNFHSTLNEIIQLKKRNSELESLLEVAGSTSHILKDKVGELNLKLAEMEKMMNNGDKNICNQCNRTGDKKVKELEENVRVLEERNLRLVHNSEELERQNRELSEHTISAIQGHSNQELSFQLRLLEKDKRIEDLQREIDKLNLEVVKRCTRQAVEKEITEVAKALMNKAYKTLKTVSRDSSLIDHSFANALREMTRAYLENYFEQKCPSLFEHEGSSKTGDDVPSRDHYEEQGEGNYSRVIYCSARRSKSCEVCPKLNRTA